MPCYVYKCPECSWTDEIVKPMSASNSVETCRQCGAVMNRDYALQGVHAAASTYTCELHSDALAIHPSQRAEHERLYPYVPLDSECRPVLSNYRQHDSYLEKRGVLKSSRRKQII